MSKSDENKTTGEREREREQQRKNVCARERSARLPLRRIYRNNIFDNIFPGILFSFLLFGVCCQHWRFFLSLFWFGLVFHLVRVCYFIEKVQNTKLVFRVIETFKYGYILNWFKNQSTLHRLCTAKERDR